MRLGIIYIIKNNINNKVYIGQTMNDITERWNAHVRRSRDLTKNYKIYNAIRKHEVSNFYIEVLEKDIPEPHIDDKEIFYIESYDSFINGYNSTRGGDGKYFDDFEELEVVSRYLNGENSTELGMSYDVSWRTVVRILEKHGIARRNRKAINNEVQFAEDYMSGMSLKVMADKYEVDIKTITRERTRLSLPNRLKRSRPSLEISFNEQEFIDDYTNGMSLLDMADKYKVDVKTIGKRRNRLNLPKRKEK